MQKEKVTQHNSLAVMPGHIQVHNVKSSEKSWLWFFTAFVVLVKARMVYRLRMVSDREKLKVFDKDSPFIATSKVGKNNPNAKEIRENNKAKDVWNAEVNKALNKGMPIEALKEIKKEEIVKPIAESIAIANEVGLSKESRANYETFRSVVLRGSKTLGRMLKELFRLPNEARLEAITTRLHEFIDFCRAPDKRYKIERDRER